jgi:hypothetical protein
MTSQVTTQMTMTAHSKYNNPDDNSDKHPHEKPDDNLHDCLKSPDDNPKPDEKSYENVI